MVQAAVRFCLLAILFVVLAAASVPYRRVPRGEVDDAAMCNVDLLQQNLLQIGRANLSTDTGKVTESPATPKIFTYWDYPEEISPLVELNVRSWLTHAPPGTELVRINDTNFRSFVPDTPDEIFKLPYAACKSDVVRAAVLYHHGGLYMDTDFVVMKDLSSVFHKLDEGWDVVAYSDNGGIPSGECRARGFTSNFMAARKGNIVSGTWWANIKAKLTRMCGQGEYEKEKVCCRAAFMDEDPQLCHVPWGHLEWLKNPDNDADARSDAPVAGVPLKRNSPKEVKVLEAVELGKRPAKALPEDARIFCFQGNESLSPHLNGEVYWQKWDSDTRATSTAKADEDDYDTRFQCKDVKGDLVCDRGQWGQEPRVIPDIWGRMAYHLFFSTSRREKRTAEEMLQSDWMIAELYRRSLGLTV